MSYKFIAILSTFLIIYSASADELSERIRTGMSKAEVSNIMESAPVSEECTTVLSISRCILVYKRGFLTPTTYTVTTVADKVVSVTVRTGKFLGVVSRSSRRDLHPYAASLRNVDVMDASLPTGSQSGAWR